MIVVLTCKCSNADIIARDFLKQGGVTNWLSIPLYQGRHACQSFLRTLPKTAEGPDPQFPLWEFIGGVDKFVVILGYTDNQLMWSNIFSDSAKAKADAEIILERFASL